MTLRWWKPPTTCAADGTTDVSIVLAPLLNNELTYTALYDEKILIATAADSALAKSVPETKAEFDKLDFSRLDAEPFITLRRGQKFLEPLLALLGFTAHCA